MPKLTEYLAVKPEGFPHFIWFERAKTLENNGLFTGRDGWGEDGAFTHLTCPLPAITARIESDTLQY